MRQEKVSSNISDIIHSKHPYGAIHHYPRSVSDEASSNKTWYYARLIPANLMAEFIPYSIGALSVLAAFNDSFGPINFVPAYDPNPVSRRPSRTADAPERQIDPPDHVIRFSNHPFSAASLANLDIEAFASRSPSPHSPQAVQSSSTFPLNHASCPSDDRPSRFTFCSSVRIWGPESPQTGKNSVLLQSYLGNARHLWTRHPGCTRYSPIIS
ncbi:hypothetical protein BGW80DRAFT_776411 [Lactifluus volemus]|nr:hypothetical protein BGW80DRAFT_776411 [Lactifluus volemus]